MEVAAYQLAGGGDPVVASPFPALDQTAAEALDPPIDPADDLRVEEVLGLRFALPQEWRTAAPGAGASGTDLFPDDPELAAAFDRSLTAVGGGSAILFGIHTDLTTEALLQATVAPLDAGGDGFEVAVSNARAAIRRTAGASLDRDETIDVPGGQGHRFRSTVTNNGRVEFGVQYVVASQTSVYVVTFTTVDAGLADELDDVGGTFELSSD